jgi:hypothetical protein
MPLTTIPSERIGHCTRMRRFFVRFNRSESFVHTRSSAGFTIITSGFEFSVHTGFSMLIRRISARSFASICGRPPSGRDLQRQKQRKPARCQRTSVSGRVIVRTCRIDGNQRYSWIRKQRAWFVNRTRPCSLRFKTSFKPQLRLEWRGQDRQNETEQPDHSASLCDSITSSTRIRFSVHTGAAYPVNGAPLLNQSTILVSSLYVLRSSKLFGSASIALMQISRSRSNSLLL